MPILRLTENESVDADDVSRIDYLPASTGGFVTELLAEENAGDVVNPASPSQLTVLLRSGREITLTGEEADAAWATWSALPRGNPQTLVGDILGRKSAAEAAAELVLSEEESLVLSQIDQIRLGADPADLRRAVTHERCAMLFAAIFEKKRRGEGTEAEFAALVSLAPVMRAELDQLANTDKPAML